MSFNIKPINTEAEYYQALDELDKIFHAEPDTKEGDKAEVISMLIEKYEDEHFPIEAPDPIEAIKFKMDQLEMKPSDLGKVLGYRSRASEILNKKRKLSLHMIRQLNIALKIPTDILVQEYELSI